MLVLFAIGYSLYLYVPIAYDGYVLKDYMQHEVDVAAAAGYDENWLKTQLTKSGKEGQIHASNSVSRRVRVRL